MGGPTSPSSQLFGAYSNRASCTVDTGGSWSFCEPIRARITRRDKPSASGPQRPIMTCQHVGREQGVGDGVGNHCVSEEALTIEGGGANHSREGSGQPLAVQDPEKG